ncbi:hypothetical protein V8J82_19570 [Gymnodinialimonas sp. 2305UL16-5]|uniref:hypothetical protein n=1 Tax=Gymnodinialimonas mytili TaxID=3126503 RepID=UPI0030A38BC9
MNAAIKNDPGLDATAEIYQRHLDTVSDLLLSGQADQAVAHFDRPFIIRISDREDLFETHDDVLSEMQSIADSLAGHGATHFIRLVKRAQRLSDTLIEGWHETYILRNAYSILPSYMSYMVLRLDEEAGLWKVAEAEHELGNLRFPLHAAHSQPGVFADRWKGKIADIRVGLTRAEPLYDAFLNVLDTHQNAGDFDAWSAQFSYPLTAHYDDSDHIFATAEEMRGFFDAMRVKFNTPGARMERRIRSAQFIAADRICGYHSTHITGDPTRRFGPVKSRMILTLTENHWACSSVTNALSNPFGQDHDLQVAPDIPTMREIQKRIRKS